MGERSVKLISLVGDAVVEVSNNSWRNTKIILVSITAGVAIVGVMSYYLRRRKAFTGTKRIKSEKLGRRLGAGDVVDSTSISASKRDNSSIGRNTASPYQGTGKSFGGRSSIASSRFTDTTLVSNSIQDGALGSSANLGFTQLGVLGLESVEKSIHYWENALALLKSSANDLDKEDKTQNPDTDKTITHLGKILSAAYTLQRLTEDLFLHENSVLYAESEKSFRLRTVSSVESFMSAEDFLSDDEEITMSLQSVGFDTGIESKSIIFPLYEAALRLVENGTVPYRSLRQNELTGCKYGDNEYLAKLHCLRGAFSRILAEPHKRNWITQIGKEVLTQILIRADKDPQGFEQSYDTFVAWSQEPGNWALTETELKERGLRALTFYDIVLDFIFLDAFEDLEAPPASVLAVTQNRWLSNSFKETALSTAVWSVLRTKRKWLRYPNGFVSHFYDVSEHMMPTLAWGYLGPPSELQDLCIYFKDKFLAFLQAIFSFDKVRYTTLDNLADDVYSRMEEMYHLVIERLEEEREEEEEREV